MLDEPHRRLQLDPSDPPVVEKASVRLCLCRILWNNKKIQLSFIVQKSQLLFGRIQDNLNI